MKVRGKGDLTDIQSARELVQQQEASRGSAAQEAERLAKKLKAQADGAVVFGTEGRVDVSLAKAISAELSPEAMASERRKRIEDLKSQIAQGKYNPPSELVAQAVGEEILMEIFSAGPDARSSE